MKKQIDEMKRAHTVLQNCVVPDYKFPLKYFQKNGVFLACWLPFFSINVSLGLCIYLGPDQYGFCEMAGSLMSSCTWLGYVNSALNPVIYTIFNLEFRNAFKKLLHIN
ncbi:unnamed protein product [Trichobilharzia regenti]|nr:unnamed protein product [Trichobilharzia regenti]